MIFWKKMIQPLSAMALFAALLIGCGEDPAATSNSIAAPTDSPRNPIELQFGVDRYETQSGVDLISVPGIELDRYLGTWYEIATIPSWFQSYCAGGVRAQYALKDDGDVEVRNSCFDREGENQELVGAARLVEPDYNSRLAVAFFFPPSDDSAPNYWVLDIDEDYTLAVVGEPSRNFGWILSRSPKITQAQLDHASEVLTRNGYDLEEFALTDQSFYIQQLVGEEK